MGGGGCAAVCVAAPRKVQPVAVRRVFVFFELFRGLPMLHEKTVEAFLDVLASDAPAPGGGSVAALNGALAASLLDMVCRLSLKRPELEGRYAELREMSEKLGTLKADLVRLITDDTEAFSEVMKAFKLPKETDEEKAARSAAIQAGYVEAVNVPLSTARRCAEVASCGVKISRGFNQNAASDLGVGMECALTGLRGAAMNVRINMPSIKDADYVRGVEKELTGLEASVDSCRATVLRALRS